MLVKNMTLSQMASFTPSDEDMAMLPLDVVVYSKVTIISISKEGNYQFIRFLFEDENIFNNIKNVNTTMIYDFAYKDRFISILELNSLLKYSDISAIIKERLEEYSHIADVVIDFFTHDDKKYRLSNLDGIVMLEELCQ